LIARRGRFDGECGGTESDAGGHSSSLEGSVVAPCLISPTAAAGSPLHSDG